MGVGLFRTEFCFLDQPEEPTVEAQVEAYRGVLEAFPGLRVKRGVVLLGVRQNIGIPICKTCTFQDFFPEQNRVDFLQARLFDAIRRHDFLQVDKARRSEVFDALAHHVEVVR